MSIRNILVTCTNLLILFSSYLSPICFGIAHAASVKVGGGGATYHMLLSAKQGFEKNSGVSLNLLQSTPKTIFMDLIDDKLNAIVIAIPLQEVIDLVVQQKITAKPEDFTQTLIGKHKTVAIVHKDNPVKNLTKAQLKDIFTGKINNWKDVGGKDQPIVVVWTNVAPGINNMFIKDVLDGAAPTKDLLQVADAKAIKETISVTTEAIGLIPLGLADEKIQIPAAPAISSDVILLHKVTTKLEEVQKLIEYFKGEGAQFIK